MKSGNYLKVLASLAIPAVGASVANAQWLATPVNVNFNNAANWTGNALPGSGTAAQFTLNSTISAITVDTARQNGLNITASTTAFTFSGGSLQIASGQGVAVSNAVTLDQTVNSPLFVASRTTAATNTMTASGSNGSRLILNGGYTGGVSTPGLSSILSLRGNAGYGVSNGVISDGTFGGSTTVTKTGGNTGTWELNGTSTYTGGTEYSGGSGGLILGNRSALGTGALRLIGGSLNIQANTDLSGANAITNTINFASGVTNTTTNASMAFTSGNNVATLNSGVSPAVGDVVSTGSAGTLPLYTRVTVVNGNQITFSDTARGTATNVITTGAFTGSGGSTLTLGGTNKLEFSGTQNLTTSASNLGAATQAYNVTNTATTTFSGVMQQQAGVASVVKNGGGTLVLSGANTYTGTTTVNAGALFINGNQSAATGVVTVATGATLGGSGTVGGATTVNGNLQPGNSPGTLSFSSSLALTGTAVSTFEINALGRGTGFDGVDVGGALTYGGGLSLAFGATFASGGVFNLFDFVSQGGALGSISVSGAYVGSLSDGDLDGTWSGVLGDQTFSFVQATGDLSILAIPEPSSFALLAGLGGMALGASRRRRRQRI